MSQRRFSWWRALAALLLLLVLRPSWLALRAVLYSPVGWAALWLVLILGYLWLHPRQGRGAGALGETEKPALPKGGSP